MIEFISPSQKSLICQSTHNKAFRIYLSKHDANMKKFKIGNDVKERISFGALSAQKWLHDILMPS